MYSLYSRLGLRITDSNLLVIRKARSKIAAKHRRNPDKRALRKEFYNRVLECHRNAQTLARGVRLI